MAGHSKWANIQHRKGRQDARRGKIFTKLIKEITSAARAVAELPLIVKLTPNVTDIAQPAAAAVDNELGRTDGGESFGMQAIRPAGE